MNDRPTDSELEPAERLERLPERVDELLRRLETVIVGERETCLAILFALLSRGHALLVGVPGVGKTLLVNALARVLGLPFSRIQFTPDLMPSDITGSEIIEEDASGRRRFEFVPGPVFTNVLLADEINRTPPKTQAALLEAMQERTVHVGGKLHRLAEPFLVLATQNPIEQEGTYPLPEAQLDRFLFHLSIAYPTEEDERRIVEQHSFEPVESLAAVWNRDEVLALRDAVARIPAPPSVVEYAVRICRASRPESGTAPDFVRRWVRWGASPRASQNLILAAKARAACEGRFNVSREDVRAIAPMVLRHRLVRSFEAEVDERGADAIVAELLEAVA
jgi:MoxR-like ATPase